MVHMAVLIVVAVVTIGVVVFAIRLFLRRAARQRAAHEERLRAMARMITSAGATHSRDTRAPEREKPAPPRRTTR